MSEIQTFDGIAQAREDMYKKLIQGDIPEARAAVADRMLTNQTRLKEIPLRLLNFVTRMKGSVNEEQQRWLTDRLLTHVGYVSKALPRVK